MEPGELKACNACARAKRKCGREFPSCSRCQSRELQCTYPAPHPSGFIFYGTHEDMRTLTAAPSPDTTLSELEIFSRESPLNLDLVGCPNQWTPLPDLQSAWFLTSESWSVAPLKLTNLCPVTKTAALKYIDQLHNWLTDWATKGSNAFIHARLYQTRQPLCIQDAFTALASYLARNPATEDMVLSIIGSRAESLINHAKEERLSSSDCYAHLSRVHAMFVYTILRLFGDDIRQRYLAEQQLPVLRAWADEMLSATRRAADNGQLLLPSSIDGHFGQQVVIPVEIAIKPDETFWHAWILSESIRRTWVAVQMVYGIYTTMQQGVSECPGGLMLTTRKGVWDATTAFTWTKLCAEKSIGFMRRDDMERLLIESESNEVDDFGKALMELDYGQERVGIWGA